MESQKRRFVPQKFLPKVLSQKGIKNLHTHTNKTVSAYLARCQGHGSLPPFEELVENEVTIYVCLTPSVAR
ncbi:hypothetical protein K7432_002267 [Basidiobolus ranarum]|uniref:Uncharacterized protein n=1 Tax=Basidiobolus ranarum TaxID=34480 RepID=A0ABR2W884_9FUNG